MTGAEGNLIDLVGALLGFVFTLCIFSYILGDNALFRLAIHIFIGVAAGYAAVMVFYNVIWPQLLFPLAMGNPSERLILLIPFILGLLLLTKASTRLAGLGTFPVAYLVGVGAAAAIGGAVMGTIFPQAGAAINLLDLGADRPDQQSAGVLLINGILSLIGTLATLIYFHFGTRSSQGTNPQRPSWLAGIALVGQGFIAVTFGALFAGAYAAALAALIERWNSIVQLIMSFVSP